MPLTFNNIPAFVTLCHTLRFCDMSSVIVPSVTKPHSVPQTYYPDTRKHSLLVSVFVQHYQGKKVRVISDYTCVSPSSAFVDPGLCLPHVYTCFAHGLPVANRSIVDLEATVQKNKGHPGDARANMG